MKASACLRGDLLGVSLEEVRAKPPLPSQAPHVLLVALSCLMHLLSSRFLASLGETDLMAWPVTRLGEECAADALFPSFPEAGVWHGGA